MILYWLAQNLSSVKSTIVKFYLGAIKFFHVEIGLSITALEDPRLDLIIRGGKRIYGEGAKAIRYPITANILLHMLNEIKNDEEGVNVKMTLCMGFATFL